MAHSICTLSRITDTEKNFSFTDQCIPLQKGNFVFQKEYLCFSEGLNCN